MIGRSEFRYARWWWRWLFRRGPGWLYTIRLTLVVAFVIAVLEGQGVIVPPRWLFYPTLVICGAVQVRILRRHRGR